MSILNRLVSRRDDATADAVRAMQGELEQRTLMSSAFVPPPGGGVGDDFVGISRAMSSMVVYGCVRLLADTIASLPWKAYRRDGNGIPVEVNPQPQIIRQPCPGFDLYQWKWMTVASLALRGNSFSLVTDIDNRGVPLGIMPLHPDAVYLERRPDILRWFDPIYRVLGEVFPSSDIVHMRRFTMPGDPWGLSPIRQAASAIGLSLAAEEYGYRYFKESANPTGVLCTDQNLDDGAVQKQQQTWIASHQGRRLPAILTGGFKWTPLSVTPEESQFLNTKRFQRSEVMMMFGIPPHMLGDQEKNTAWGCLPGDSLVATTHGPVPIEDVKVGDEVYSFDGEKMVTAKVTGWQMTGHKPLVTVKTRGRELRLTANHRVPVRRYFGKSEAATAHPSANPEMRYIKVNRSGNFQVLIRRADLRYSKTFKTVEDAVAARDSVLREAGLNGSCGWRNIEITAGEVREGDMLLVPHAMGTGDRRVGPDGQELTVGMMEIAGLYLGDGSRDLGRIEIAHAVDEDHMPHYRDVIRQEFGVEPYTDPRGRRTRFSSREAIRLIESGFTGKAGTKRVPDWAFRLAPDLQAALLRGYLDSDGSVTDTERPSASWSSINKMLLEDIRQLCMQLGIPVGSVFRGRDAGPMTIEGRTYESQVKYVLSVNSPEHLHLIGANSPRKASRMVVPVRQRVTRYQDGWTGANQVSASRKAPAAMRPGDGFDAQGVVLHRVVSVVRGAVDVPVYDIEVAGPAHYVADGVVVHNSGIEQLSLGFVTYTLRAWTSCIESVISNLLPRGQFVRFDFSDLLRGDIEKRYEAYQKALMSSWMSPNEIRALEEMEPIKGGDTYLQQVTLAPLGYSPTTDATLGGDAFESSPKPESGSTDDLPAEKLPSKTVSGGESNPSGKGYPETPTGKPSKILSPLNGRSHS